MGYIITLSGTRCVGKSHIVKQLVELLSGWYIRENPTEPISSQYNTCIEEEYYENERLYINRQLQEYTDLRRLNKNAILVRGPEDLRFYIEKYPKTIGKKWNVEKALSDELKDLEECKSDLIIFLYAKKEIIQKRCKEDLEKRRNSIDDWLNNWHDDIFFYMQNKENCIFIDTSNMQVSEVTGCVVSLIQEKVKNII